VASFDKSVAYLTACCVFLNYGNNYNLIAIIPYNCSQNASLMLVAKECFAK